MWQIWSVSINLSTLFGDCNLTFFFTKILRLLLKKKVQHFVIPVAICNKIVALCNKTCRKLVTNLKWLFGGQVNPIISIIIDNNNNSFFLTKCDRTSPRILRWHFHCLAVTHKRENRNYLSGKNLSLLFENVTKRKVQACHFRNGQGTWV